MIRSLRVLPALAPALLLTLAACGDSEGGSSGGGDDTTAQTGPATTGAGPATTTGSGAGGGGATSGATTTSSVASSGSGGAGGGAPGLVPIFLAQGHLGRTTISCDDGHTWIRDQSVDDGARCFEGGLDCDHHPFAGRGIAYGDDTFVLTWGWGAPGEVHRTRDASGWEVVLTETGTFADLAFGNGRFVANGGTTWVSDDAGATWTEGGSLDLGINTRAIDYAPAAGRFLVTGESGDQRAIVHSADGVTWSPAAQRPAECISQIRGLAEGNGAIVAAGGQGVVCTSTDGGATWTSQTIGDSLSSNILWTGTEFIVYERATAHRSTDGVTWTSEAASPGNVAIGPMARSADGTFVAANDGWMVWYEQQAFYRSEDGINWEVLPAGSFTGSHPINFIEAGWVEPTSGCGLP